MATETRPLSPRTILLLVAGLVLLVALAGYRFSAPPSGGTALGVFSGVTMGTTYTVKIVSETGEFEAHAIEEAAARVAEALEDVNAKMSTYLPGSELSRFNASSSTEAFAMSPETLEVFDHARQVSDATGGAFDITVGPLVDAWGFGPEERSAPPSDDEIQALQACTGYEKVAIDLDAGTVTKALPGLACDLSAIAKGYGVDQAARALEALGFENYMVEVGGETRAQGLNDRGVVWRIGIEKPTSEGRSVQRPVSLSGESIATSGDYRNYYEQDGVRVSHTIDPRTGRPISHALASVSVIHAECVDADAYATALMVLGPEEGFRLAEALGLKALFLVRTPDGSVETLATSHFTREVDGAAVD